jgi:hypothetical protein
MHCLRAFSHSKLEAVLYASLTSPYRFTPLDSEAVMVFALTHSPLSCILFRARRQYHI